jgi:hypothetical protein
MEFSLKKTIFFTFGRKIIAFTIYENVVFFCFFYKSNKIYGSKIFFKKKLEKWIRNH